MVPRAVIRVAIAIILAIRLILCVIVCDNIIEGEPVVRCDKVHTGPRFATASVEQFSRTCYATGKLGQRAFVAFPESADSIPETIVPLGPTWGKSADLVPAGSTRALLCG